jgi:hypothetical protein
MSTSTGTFRADETMGFDFSFDDFPHNTNVATQTRDPHWLTVFNTSASVLSQFLASRGRYPTTQVGTSGVSALSSNSPYGASYAAQQGTLYGANASQNVGSFVGSGVGSGVDGIINWAAQNPLLVAGGALGLFLLFREPPRRR